MRERVEAGDPHRHGAGQHLGTELDGGERLEHGRVVARHEDDPVGYGVAAADLLLARGGQLRCLGLQEMGAGDAWAGRKAGEQTQEMRAQSLAFSGLGERRRVSTKPATPPPKLSMIRHWLRTMFRWCGIILVDQGVGSFSRAT